MIRILLVDDDPSIQRTYGKFLKGEGYEVYQAEDAEIATELLLRHTFDLVLLDINMPGLDGTVMREVIDTYDENLKVVVSSVYPLSEQRKRIVKADDYFDKSHGTEWLKRIIRNVLGETDRQNQKPQQTKKEN